MPTATQSAPVSERFSSINFFLQPVRDLAKNWDIEVAPLLEEYLIELEKVQISFDGGSTTMNFAEAALLIQGSACVYSKKVEYLYDLVYRTLDLISSKKRLQQASSVDNQGNDKDVTREKEEEFLSLDDIEECKNIDLKEDDEVPCSEGSKIIPRTPLALIPIGERDKKDVLLSHTGEVLGSRNDFKMNTCTVHASGALLLDLGNLMLAETSFRRLPASTPQSCFDAQGTTLQHVKEPYRPPESLEPPQEINGVEVDMPNEPNEDIHDYNNDGDAYDGNDMYDDDDDAVNQQEDMPEEETQERMQLRRRDKQQQLQIHKQMLKVQDSWELLDPHSPGRTVDKPFKKGKPFKIPPSIMESKCDNKKKRKRNETKPKKPYLMPLHEFCTQAFYSHSSKFPKNPLKAPEYKEFEYLYWIEFRRRQEIEKKQKKLLSQYLTEEEINDLESVVPDFKEEPEEQDDVQHYAPDNDDDNDFVGNEDNEPTAPMALEDPPEELVVSSYEDLVRRYVEGYLQEAQQYAQETDLSRRVHEWEKKIVPTLHQEELHRPYDIHQYGSEILGLFEEEKDTTFDSMMNEKDSFEVCRYFLATLQLANNYNVEIGAVNHGAYKADTMCLKLLHKTPAHKAIQTYRAPSILT